MLVLVVTRAGPAVVRALRGGRRGDRAAWALELAVGGLPAARATWGQAMLVELDQVRGPRARRRFSLGCIRAATAIRVRAMFAAHDRGGDRVRALVLALIAAALALAVYGLLRYPDLRAGAGAGTWAAAGAVLLLGYVVCVATLARGTTPAAAADRRRGVLAGLVVGAAWLVVIAPTSSLKAWVLLALLIALACPALVAVRTGQAAHDIRTATGTALWSGLVAGLLDFIVLATTTYARHGGPYDPQLVRDFHRSGARELASYAVAGNLGVALGLLVVVPVLALALGSLGALASVHRAR